MKNNVSNFCLVENTVIVTFGAEIETTIVKRPKYSFVWNLTNEALKTLFNFFQLKLIENSLTASVVQRVECEGFFWDLKCWLCDMEIFDCRKFQKKSGGTPVLLAG